MNPAALRETGIEIALDDQVLRLADLTRAAGLDGVVASPRETSAIRARCGEGFLIVTPGIRGGAALPQSSGQAPTKDDQERTMSPAEAAVAGASYLVVGRPIIAAQNPKQAAEAIASSLGVNR